MGWGGGQEGWLAGLEGAGFNRGVPTVWLAEGLLMYLDPARVPALLRDMAAASAPGSCLLLQSITESLLEKSRSSVSQLLRSWCFGLCFLCCPFLLPVSTLMSASALSQEPGRSSDIRERGRIVCLQHLLLGCSACKSWPDFGTGNAALPSTEGLLSHLFRSIEVPRAQGLGNCCSQVSGRSNAVSESGGVEAGGVLHVR